MTTEQQGDVRIFQTTDDGEINVENGLFEMSPGLDSMAYLCMFGGNEDDDGADGNLLQWWGNFGEPLTERKYRSETQYLLASIPSTSGNLKRIQDAAERDLSVFVSEGIATDVSVSVSIPKLNAVSIDVQISALGSENINIQFIETWKASVK